MNAIAQASAAPVTGPKLDNRRVAAALVDLIIVAAGAAVVLLAGDALTGDGSEVRGALGSVIIGWALYYFFATESGDGQTLGKKLLKLRVVRADGRPAGMREIAVRTILRVVDNYLVGLIVMLATGDRRQRIGDLAAGTIVVDASAATVAPAVPLADVAEEAAGDEPPAAAKLAEPAPTQTITLPARPTPPATLADLTDPEEPAVDVEPAVEDEAAVEVSEELPPVMSASLEELAQDVAAAHSEPEVEEAGPVEDAAAEGQPDEPADERPVNVKSVETVSAMDLIMGAAEADAQSSADSEPDAGDSASE